jgi:predicted RNase H-like HicB family nuclease
MQKVLFIRAEWDDEAQLWVATSDDVPGLVTEADTLENLSAKLQTLVSELLEADGLHPEAEVPFELLARKFATARAKPQ